MNDHTRRFYAREGYCVLESVLDEDALLELDQATLPMYRDSDLLRRGLLIDYMGGHPKDVTEIRLPQVLDPVLHNPRVRDSIFTRKAFEWAAELLGEDTGAFVYQGSHMILKVAGCTQEVPWHQDEAYWDPSLDYQTVSFFVATCDCAVESGGLIYIPGSQLWGILPHQRRAARGTVYTLEIVGEPRLHPQVEVPCSIRRGDVVAHAPRTVHRSGPNLSEAQRNGIVINVGLPPVRRATPKPLPWSVDYEQRR